VRGVFGFFFGCVLAALVFFLLGLVVKAGQTIDRLDQAGRHAATAPAARP
jgi:hypothetical protein